MNRWACAFEAHVPRSAFCGHRIFRCTIRARVKLGWMLDRTVPVTFDVLPKALELVLTAPDWGA